MVRSFRRAQRAVLINRDTVMAKSNMIKNVFMKGRAVHTAPCISKHQMVTIFII